MMLFLSLFTTISAMGVKCQRHINSSTVCSDDSKQQMPTVAGKSLKTYCLNNKRTPQKNPAKFYTNKKYNNDHNHFHGVANSIRCLHKSAD
jgi:hypothetical protein